MAKKTAELKLEKTLDSQSVYKELERIVNVSKTTYSDAIVHYCQRTGNEVETIAEIVKKNPKIVSQLQDEYEILNMLPKTSRLPI